MLKTPVSLFLHHSYVIWVCENISAATERFNPYTDSLYLTFELRIGLLKTWIDLPVLLRILKRLNVIWRRHLSLPLELLLLLHVRNVSHRLVLQIVLADWRRTLIWISLAVRGRERHLDRANRRRSTGLMMMTPSVRLLLLLLLMA